MVRIFGYLKPYKNDLKVSQYYTYKHFYCSLCTELGSYGFFNRLLLSYEATFLFVFLDALSLKKNEVRERCPLHKEKGNLASGEALRYVAFVNYWLFIHKLEDNFMDSGRIRGAFYKVIYKIASHNHEYRRNLTRFKLAEKEWKMRLKEYYKCEMRGEQFDCISNAYADFMLSLFQGFFEYNPSSKYISVKNQVDQIAINIGKMTWVADAFDDYFQDKEGKCFNLLTVMNLNCSSQIEIIKEVFSILNCLQGQACEELNSIEVENRDIIMNHLAWFDCNLISKIKKQKGKYSWNKMSSFQTYFKQ